jgi:osmoprotectant transport system permease protein
MSVKIKLVIMGVVVVFLTIILISTQRENKSGGFTAAFDAEFLARPDGYPGLKEVYDIEFSSPPLQMDPGLMYRALADGTVNVIDGFATDGRIPAYNLVTLEDDKGFFPPYYAAPLVRGDALKKYPEVEEILNRLAGTISDKAMQEMNYQVDEEGLKAADVAEKFLLSQGLIKTSGVSKKTQGRITVGGKHFTEQEILGEIISLMIERNSDIRIERRLNLGGTIICFNALKSGDIDIYVEYTGTGLVNILKEEVISNPDAAYEKVRDEFEKRYNLIWLKPLGFNNTYTLTIRGDEAGRLGIKTISDLSEFLSKH